MVLRRANEDEEFSYPLGYTFVSDSCASAQGLYLLCPTDYVIRLLSFMIQRS